MEVFDLPWWQLAWGFGVVGNYAYWILRDAIKKGP
jgi:hypothetical protein